MRRSTACRGAPTCVGIRPDQTTGGGEGIALSGVVDLVEPVGGESHLYVRVEGLKDLLVLVRQGRSELIASDRIDFVLPMGALHPFNRETGRRTD